MSLKKRSRNSPHQETLSNKHIALEDSVNLRSAKPPETLFQLVLHVLDRIGGRRGQLLMAVILICGAFTFFWSQVPEQSKLNIINHIFDGTPSSAGVYPSVEIDQSTLKYDFTDWTPAPSQGDASQSCKVTTDEELNVRRVRNDAKYLARRVGTSGIKPEFTFSTHPISYQESNYERVGGVHMAHYDVLLDISKEPVNVPFNAHLRAVRYGAFRDKNHEWAAASVFQPTRVLIIEIQFSTAKLGRNFQFGYSAESDGNNTIPLHPTLGQLMSPDSGQYELTGNILRWTIQYPKLGYCYRIDWDW